MNPLVPTVVDVFSGVAIVTTPTVAVAALVALVVHRSRRQTAPRVTSGHSEPAGLRRATRGGRHWVGQDPDGLLHG